VKKIIPFLLRILLATSGCAKLAHIRELITLKNYSDEQASIDAYVQDQDEKFGFLVEEIKSGLVSSRTTEQSFRDAFGDPAIAREEVKEGVPYKVLVYRRVKDFFGGEKVYLYFDQQGVLRDLKYLPPNTKE